MRTYLVQAIICTALLSPCAGAVCGPAKPLDPRAPRNSDGKVFVHPGISFAVKKSAPGFKPLGLKFE